MSKKRPVCPTHKANNTRQQAKLKRGRGQLAIEKSGMTEIEWCRKSDPLYKVKGERRIL